VFSLEREAIVAAGRNVREPASRAGPVDLSKCFHFLFEAWRLLLSRWDFERLAEMVSPSAIIKAILSQQEIE